MLGLLALGLTTIMIYTLVKNALVGKQLSQDDQFRGTVELIIPLTPKSEFFLVAWQKAAESFQFSSTQLRIHLLVDGHHPSLNVWQELKSKILSLEIHSFPMRPTHVEAVPWMLEQISSQIKGDVVIIGDAELVPSANAFASAASKVIEKNRSYFIVPQTAKTNLLGESISVLNPTLALASFFGTAKWRKNITQPLLSISQGWMCMTLQTFKAIDFKMIRISTWKEAISRQWEDQNKKYYLAFGEKQLTRFYPEDLKTLVYQLRNEWEDLWNRKVKTGFVLFLTTLFLWSFPMICLFTHPYWSITSFFLLVLYRFFTKIVFQESWKAIFLHPVACLMWIGSFFWWLSGQLKSKYGSQTSLLP